MLVRDGDTVSGAVDLPRDNAPSGLVLSPGGSRLYVANRGPNSISVFAIDGRNWPRDIALIDGVLYICNQRSGDVMWFRPGDDGIPTLAGALLVPAPARVL